MDLVIPKTPWELPEYRQAVERESFIRDAAFIGATETIGGFECRAMTLKDFLLLRISKNALLCGGIPTPEQLLAFLWLLSPQYAPGASRARARLVASCAKFLPPKKPLIHFPWLMKRWRARAERHLAAAAEMIGAIRLYLQEALMDWPSCCAQGEDAAFYGDACALCAKFAREYHCSFKDTMELPMKCLLQFQKESKLHRDGPG